MQEKITLLREDVKLFSGTSQHLFGYMVALRAISSKAPGSRSEAISIVRKPEIATSTFCGRYGLAALEEASGVKGKTTTKTPPVSVTSEYVKLSFLQSRPPSREVSFPSLGSKSTHSQV